MEKRKQNVKIILIERYLLIFVVGFLLSSIMYEFQITGNVIHDLEPMHATEPVYASANVVAVSSYDNSGIIGSVIAEIHPDGKGRVLMNTNPFLEPDTQQSAELATRIAEQYTGISLDDRDVIFSFEMPGEVLGGPSAGAAMTASVIAAIEKRSLSADIVVTGTIEEDGSIGQIGGVLEKAQAAAEHNMTLFLVPEGQSELQYYERQIKEQQIGRFIYQTVYYVPRLIDLNNYTMQWNMPTREVKTINDVVSYMVR